MMHAEMRRLIIIATLAACSDKSAPPSPSPTPTPVESGDDPVLVTQDEITAWSKDVADRVAAHAARSCQRPVVRPPAVAGPALAHQRALVDPKGPVGACIEQLRVAALAEHPEAALAALAGDCMPTLGPALHDAVSHSDACSPVQVGSGPAPDLRVYTRFAHVIAATKEPWALVELVAHLQDLSRGAVPTIVSHDADEAMAIALTALVDLAQHTKLPAELGPALASLQAAMPGLADSFAAQHDLESLAADSAPAVDAKGMIFLGMRQRAEVVGKACPTTATLAQCHAGITKLTSAPAPQELPLEAAIAAVRAKPADREAIRTRVAAWVGYPGSTIHAQQVADRARNVAALATLQVLVAAQRMSTCPIPPQLASAPLYKTLLAPPLLGAPLRIAGAPVRIAPPAFVTPHVEWNILCP